MSKTAIFLAEGYEEIEALTVVDLCRRAGIEITMVSVTGDRKVRGSHGITVTADALFDDVDFESEDMLILPGGMPGTRNLEAHEGLMKQIDSFYRSGKYIAAICAAPTIFGHRGILNGRKACCYPGMEGELKGANVSYEQVSVSDHVITSRGMGCAIPFGLKIVEIFCGEEKAKALSKAVVYTT